MNQTPASFEVEVMEGFLYRGKPIAAGTKMQCGAVEMAELMGTGRCRFAREPSPAAVFIAREELAAHHAANMKRSIPKDAGGGRIGESAPTRTYRLRVTRGCLIAGQPYAEGVIIDVGDKVAFDVLQIGVAEPVDPAEFTMRPRWGWINREPVDPPPIRLVVAA